MKLTLVHLYPELMNIYGDRGNIEAFKFRLEKRKIQFQVRLLRPQQTLVPGSFDLLFSGGGQDQQQVIISQDLVRHQKVIKQAAEQGIPMLTICGSYQLFGHYFRPFHGPKLKGIGLFDNYTIASKQRQIGNIIINLQARFKSLSTKYVVGFENHSGRTFLGKHCQPLGQVISGSGNNGQDKTEGSVFRQAIGCYLHGPLLPKNPHLADWLIAQALEKKYGKIRLQPLDDRLEWLAQSRAIKRTKKLRRSLLKYIL
jgi:CobQ-like glutamine amidotransferase family enzyme